MERLSDVWAFPAGAGRAVAVSRIKFPEPAEGVIRVRSAFDFLIPAIEPESIHQSPNPPGFHP